MSCLMMQQHWNWTNAIYLMLFIIHTMDQSIMRHGQMLTKKRGPIYMAHRKQEEAERGNAYAMYDMGKIYTQGIFVEPDEEKAEKWYNRALSAMLAVNKEKKNACLQYHIGKMYQYGPGTGENLTEAAAWFSKAAEKEYSSALYSLGMLTLHGKGVAQDHAKAFALF